MARASLHNREEVERRGVREGDLVRIQRAGDVIPQVVERIEEENVPRAKEFKIPENCPVCETEVIEKGPFSYCPNRFGCSAQLKRGILHFGSREGLDIEGLGEEICSMLVDRGLVSELADLFSLKTEDLQTLWERWEEGRRQPFCCYPGEEVNRFSPFYLWLRNSRSRNNCS